MDPQTIPITENQTLILQERKMKLTNQIDGQFIPEVPVENESDSQNINARESNSTENESDSQNINA